MSVRLVFKGAVLFFSLAIVVVALKVSGLDATLNEKWIDAHVRNSGLQGQLLFLLMGAAFTGVGMPRQFVGFLGGYAFGLTHGAIIAVAAAALGCAAAFFYSRFLGRSLVKGRFPDKVDRIDEFLAQNPFSMTVLIRFLPVGSNLATNLAAGVSGVNFMPFILGSILGYIPQQLIFALVGSGIGVDTELRVATAAVLFLAAGLIGGYLYRKYRRGKVHDKSVAENL